MAQKKIGMSIDEALNERWNEVAKKHDLSKSGMVEEYLMTILPILEAETPNKMMARAMKKMSEEIDTTATLFDNMKHDESLKEYKENKRGLNENE